MSLAFVTTITYHFVHEKTVMRNVIILPIFAGGNVMNYIWASIHCRFSAVQALLAVAKYR